MGTECENRCLLADVAKHSLAFVTTSPSCGRPRQQLLSVILSFHLTPSILPAWPYDSALLVGEDINCVEVFPPYLKPVSQKNNSVCVWYCARR